MQDIELISLGVLALLAIVLLIDLVKAKSSRPSSEKVLQRVSEQKGTASEVPAGASASDATVVEEAAPTADVPVAEKAPRVEVPISVAPTKESLFARMKQGLGKTRSGLTDGLSTLFLGQKTIDDDLLEEIETLLLTSDVGMAATTDIIANVTEKVSKHELKDAQALYALLTNERY